ncbi:MAG: outer membrane beta-barrel protein [Nibricoccus sp.]
MRKKFQPFLLVETNRWNKKKPYFVMELSPKFPGVLAGLGNRSPPKSTMRTKIAVLCGLLIAAPFLHAAGSENSRFYLDSKIEYLFFDTGPKLKAGVGYPYGEHTFKNAPAISLSSGINLNNTHALELQVMYFDTETKSSPYTIPSYLYADPKTKLEAVPLLIGYKNRSKLSENWSLYFGVSAGVTWQRTKTTNTYIGQSVPGYETFPRSWTQTNNSNVFTYATEIGTEYKLNDRSAITAGAKLMGMSSGKDTTQGTIKAINLGYKFRF